METEGLGKYELDGEEKISEFSEESEIYEMPTGDSDSTSTCSRPELKGGRHMTPELKSCDRPRSELRAEEILTSELIGEEHYMASECSQHGSTNNSQPGVRVDSQSTGNSLRKALISPKISQHPDP